MNKLSRRATLGALLAGAAVMAGCGDKNTIYKFTEDERAKLNVILNNIFSNSRSEAQGAEPACIYKLTEEEVNFLRPLIGQRIEGNVLIESKKLDYEFALLVSEADGFIVAALHAAKTDSNGIIPLSAAKFPCGTASNNPDLNPDQIYELAAKPPSGRAPNSAAPVLTQN